MATSEPPLRISRQTSKPFFPGSMMSSMITSNGSLVALASPLGPSVAVATAYPSASSRSESVSTRPGSSSINRIREFINFFSGRSGDPQHELGLLSGFAVHGHSASVRLHDPFDQAQAQARAMDLIGHRRLASIER